MDLAALGPYCQDLGADILPVRPSRLVNKIYLYFYQLSEESNALHLE